MDMDNRVGIDCGSGGGWVGQWRIMGGNWDNCNRTTRKEKKKDEIMPLATAWLDLGNIMLCEISQIENVKNHMPSLAHELYN